MKALQRQGVILAVCSKNDPENAKEGFSHPDSVLKLEDFAAFKTNWDPKPESIRQIAFELNLGLDSIVFVDDNPAERALVAEQLPSVAVPDVGSDVALFADVLDRERYFEAHKLVQDDLVRGAYYSSNTERDSCRVFKREMEFAMFDALVEQCQVQGIRRILRLYPLEEEWHRCGALRRPRFQPRRTSL